MTYLYVIGRERGPVKVGISDSPRARLSQLQTGCPFKLELLHFQEMRSREHAETHERNFHDVYANKRLMGEWFQIDVQLAVELIETGLDVEAHFESRAA